MYISTVGTVASASYYWSREWHQPVAGDFHLEAGGQSLLSPLVLFFVFCCSAEAPFLSLQVAPCRRCSCADVESCDTAPRFDAGETRTGIGGWWLVLDTEGRTDPWRSPWCSLSMGVRVGPEQDSSSTSHFFLMITTMGVALDIVGNAGEGEGVEAWRRLVLEFESRAKSGVAGLMQKLLAFEFTSDTAFFELFDKECLGLNQVTGIDIQDEVKCGLVTLRMPDSMLRHHLIMHANAHADWRSNWQG